MMPILVALATIAVFVLASAILSRIYHYLRKQEYAVPVWDISKGHHWAVVESVPGSVYCNVCESSVPHGASCDFCGITVHDGCRRRADAALACKTLACMGTMKHHWVHGNLDSQSLCEVCEELCGDGPGLVDYRCCWCQACVHTGCMASYTAICNLGNYKRFIIPPTCVRLKLVGWKGRRHFTVKEAVKPEGITNWSPLIVVANRLSGNGEGEQVLREFRRILNPVQVLDLNQVPPDVGLAWCTLLADVKCRFLIAGGDGTVGWILHCAEKLKLPNQPEFVIFPLGTGNDLSRDLGWGPGHTGAVCAHDVIRSVSSAHVQKLDRWLVNVQPARSMGLTLPAKHLYMSNYCSIGVDALVTLNFDRSRRRLPRVLSGRLINKFLFFSYGTRDVLERACKHLSEYVQLYLDGKQVEVKDLEGIVFLNIAHWGAGVRPWTLGYRDDVSSQNVQALDDKRIEVFGLYSSFHIAQMQVGLSEPYRLGQASHVKLLVKKGAHLPMQVDGEPWSQGAGTITVQHYGQVHMLASASALSPTVGDAVRFSLL